MDQRGHDEYWRNSDRRQHAWCRNWRLLKRITFEVWEAAGDTRYEPGVDRINLGLHDEQPSYDLLGTLLLGFRIWLFHSALWQIRVWGMSNGVLRPNRRHKLIHDSLWRLRYVANVACCPCATPRQRCLDRTKLVESHVAGAPRSRYLLELCPSPPLQSWDTCDTLRKRREKEADGVHA